MPTEDKVQGARCKEPFEGSTSPSSLLVTSNTPGRNGVGESHSRSRLVLGELRDRRRAHEEVGRMCGLLSSWPFMASWSWFSYVKLRGYADDARREAAQRAAELGDRVPLSTMWCTGTGLASHFAES